jgi:hypothetical protein
MSAFSLLALIVVAWLPGAVILRLPIGSREKRAALDADERLFWAVMLSVAASLAVVLGLAAIERYTFQRLLIANVLIAGALAVVARFNLRLGPGARRPGSSAVLAAALVMLGLWRFFPTSEYVIGGKDPGVYIGEGIQIAQRGTLAYDDPVVASVPPFARDLFFPSHERPDYYGIRFMGFFIRNPDTGTVVGQFPHLFPASVAIGYGIRGLSGARETVAAWGILGLLAVYFLGRRLAGTPAAFAAATLLSLHVIEVWFARYPNAEMVMQTLVFTGLLASSRAHSDDDAFFAPVAGVMLGLLLFLRFDAILPLAGFAAGLGLVHLRGGRVRPSLIGTTLLAGLLAVPYYLGPMRAYIDRPLVFLWGLEAWQYVVLGAAIAGGVVMLAAARRWASYTQKIVAFAPPALGAAVVIGAIYGLVFRRQTGKLAIHDAESLRTFTTLYATMPGIVAGLIGYVTAARRVFWRAPEVFTTVAVFSFFLFYKIRIVPEHFWMARRFLAVILPGVLIFACAAASWGLRRQGRGRWTSAAIGAVFVALLASEYARVSRPLIGHVEYAGIIPELEQLASRIGENELLIVESRDAGSDAHVMALPLAYIYARNVLVLASPRPDRQAFAPFLEWARNRYGRVFFLGGGGTELLSAQWSATSVASQRFQVPEYEVSVAGLPRGVRMKEFDFGLYELLPASAPAPGIWFDLDVGIRDDLNVVRFHAKEMADGHTMRWTQRQSFVTVPALAAGARTLVLDMSSGGRPEAAPPAEISVYLDEQLLGSARVGNGFRPYTFAIPEHLAAAAAAAAEPVRIRLVTPVWNPRQVLGSPDGRELGVMLDRVQVR